MKEAKSRKPLVISIAPSVKQVIRGFVQGPYAVAVVVIATLKCAGGKKGKGSSRVGKRSMQIREIKRRHVLVCVVVNGDEFPFDF